MSYCRWSSNNWDCDLYCYADANGGWTTHIAGSRVVGDIPKTDWVAFTKKEITPEEFTVQYKAQMDFLETCQRKPIGLPHDGETFTSATIGEFRERIVMLREMGYHAPDYVLEEIDAEIKESPDGVNATNPCDPKQA